MVFSELSLWHWGLSGAQNIAAGRIDVPSTPRPLIEMFQSTPDIAVGRNPAQRAISEARGMFQSTPDIAVGRNRLAGCVVRRVCCFNPRPTSLSGETAVGLWLVLSVMVFQSTPDIAVGRNLAVVSGICARRRFNPRPTSLSGETIGVKLQACHLQVSIHARHRCRAKPQSSPCAWGRACFNPRPTSLSGETRRLLLPLWGRPSFNPRPTSLSGETRQGHRNRVDLAHVSIHARHRCRAKHPAKTSTARA